MIRIESVKVEHEENTMRSYISGQSPRYASEVTIEVKMSGLTAPEAGILRDQIDEHVQKFAARNN